MLIYYGPTPIAPAIEQACDLFPARQFIIVQARQLAQCGDDTLAGAARRTHRLHQRPVIQL